jgi:hypothetical protein
MSAWKGWYHCTGSTYGAWVRGDPRGWRSRKHHEHVEGDYKSPPPRGKFDRQYKHSKKLMTRQRVVFTSEQRAFACSAMVDALVEREVDVGAFCVGAKHWHGLLRFRNPTKHYAISRDAQTLIGQAKGKTAHSMSKANVISSGGIWAHRSRVRPVKNRFHALKITEYIPDHAKKGAAIYVPSSAKPGALAPGPNQSR